MKPLDHARRSMVSDEDVNDIGCAADKVHPRRTSLESVRSVVSVVQGRLEREAERLQGLGRMGRDSTGGLNMEDHVDIVRWAKRVDSTVYGVELGHQPTDESPLAVRKHCLDLSDVGPGRSPSSRWAGYVDGWAVNHGTRPARGRACPVRLVARGRRVTQQDRAPRARRLAAQDRG